MLFTDFKLLKTFFFLLGTNFLLAETLRIMPLGDSITFDQKYGDTRTDGSRTGYRSFLWYKLTNAKYDVDFVGSQVAGQAVTPIFDPDNEGHPGWDSYDIAGKVLSYMNNSQPDIVLLHIGTNDRGSTSPEGVNLILDEIDYYEQTTERKVRVIVALIINTKDNDERIKIFNRRINQLLAERISSGDNIEIVDMYRGAGFTQSDFTDRLHPNPSGYSKMADVWFNALTADKEEKDLYVYPYTHIDKFHIESITVEKNIVHYITNVPDTGITF